MRQRCYNKNNPAYKNYGARGITVCDEWNDYSAFREWAHGVGYDDNAERGKYTIDRIDVNGNYSPNNCRFVDTKTQSNNIRNTIYVTHDGVTMALSDWADATGIKYQTLWKRYRRGLDADGILKR